jgi:hypothetical protein
MLEMLPVMSLSARSVKEKMLGSIATARLPTTTKAGPVTVAPASVSKVRLWLPPRKLTVSPPPPRLIAPMMREPGSKVSVSGLPKNWIAAVVPKMIPALVTLPVKPWIPMPWPPPEPMPEMTPKFVMLAVVAAMPKFCTPPALVMVPKLVTLATLSARMPKLTLPGAAVPEMKPKLVTLAVGAAIPAPLMVSAIPEMVPKFVTLAVSLTAMPMPLPPMPVMRP